MEGVRSHLAGDDDKTQLNLLKDLAGIERGDETPSTAAVASLAFLFLLVNIYESHLKYVYAYVASFPGSASLHEKWLKPEY